MTKSKKNTLALLAESLQEMEEQRNISIENVSKALKVAIETAYSKNAHDDEVECRCDIDLASGDVKLFWIRDVVEVLEHDFDDDICVTLEEARKTMKNAKVGDKFETLVPLDSLSRLVYQRIQSGFTQQLAEISKKLVYDKFKKIEKNIITGEVERVEEGKYVLVNLGEANGYMSYKDTIPGEKYRVGDLIKVYVKSVNMDSKKEPISLSRSDAGFLFKLFSQEIVEIDNGDVYIRNIARLPGVRSKVVVSSKIPGLDAAGTCIGRNGTRIAKIVEQLNNGQEKIDVIQYYDDPCMMVKAALSPAIVQSMRIRSEQMEMDVYNKETKQKEKKSFFGKVCDVAVSNETFQIAIGSKGQNAFLAKKLSKFDKLNIKKVEEVFGDSGYRSMAEIEAEYEARVNPNKIVEETKQTAEEIIGDEDNTVIIEEVIKDTAKKETSVVSEGKKETKEVYVSNDVSKGPHISVVEEKKEEKVEEKVSTGPSKKSLKKEEEEKKKMLEEESKKKGMNIYTEEELAELENEDIEDDEEEEIDYEDYEDYYEDM